MTALEAATAAVDALDYRDLKSLRATLDSLITDRRQQAEAELERRRQEIAAELGLDAKTANRRGRQIKYRDPDNPDNVWSGRGDKPAWLDAKLADGARIEDFDIST